MAKVYEEVIIIKLSKLIKDDMDPDAISNKEIVSALVSVAEELVGSGVIVEAEVSQ